MAEPLRYLPATPDEDYAAIEQTAQSARLRVGSMALWNGIEVWCEPEVGKPSLFRLYGVQAITRERSSQKERRQR